MQVVERSGNSIVQSLSELRDIERQRIADEISALQRADAARIAAREAAERQAREEEAARVQADREARLAAEHARMEAEREERRRIDAAAAAELARQQVALEETRREREHELRRAEVARTRPTWMMAVMALSLAAAGVLLWLSLGSRAIAEDASSQARLALLDRDRARDDAREARDGLARVQRELEENARTLRSILTDIGHAKKQIDLDALEARARREQQRIDEIEARRKKATDERERQIRNTPIVIPEECKQNAFARGCPGA
jgi:hypothetical protein